MNELLQHIDNMRKFRGLTKRELCAAAGISEEYYWRILTGAAPGAAYTIINALCAAVGLTITITVDPATLKVTEISTKPRKKVKQKVK